MDQGAYHGRNDSRSAGIAQFGRSSDRLEISFSHDTRQIGELSGDRDRKLLYPEGPYTLVFCSDVPGAVSLCQPGFPYPPRCPRDITKGIVTE